MDAREQFPEWLAAAQKGSSEALGQALEACRAYLLLVAEREIDPALRAKGGASDIVQETFVEAHRAFGHFTSESQEEFLAWLRAMLLNNVKDFRRKFQGTQKRSANREIALDAHDSSTDLRGLLAADSASPSGQFNQLEMFMEIESALKRLPDDYQQVISLRYNENCSFEEIAQRMQRTANAVQKLFARAIDRLQAEMGREQ